MLAAVLIIGISAIVVAVEIRAAPIGWQDDDGFHFGHPSPRMTQQDRQRGREGHGAVDQFHTDGGTQ